MTRGKRGGGSGNNFKKNPPMKTWKDPVGAKGGGKPSSGDKKTWPKQNPKTGKSTTPYEDEAAAKRKGNWKAAGKALTAGAEVAGHMADKHKAANAGLTSSSAYGDFGAGQSYDTTPHTATRKLNKKTDNWEY